MTFTAPPETPPAPAWCQSKEDRRLWSGRMCWSEAARVCASCRKHLCYAHAVWRVDDQFTCAGCTR